MRFLVKLKQKLIFHMFFYKNKGKNNKIIFSNARAKIKIKIRGNNNIIQLGKLSYYDKVKFEIKGNNNKINIGENVHVSKGSKIMIQGNNCIFEIGKNTDIGENFIPDIAHGAQIKIGENCMIARDVHIRTWASHDIYDIVTQKVTNFPENVILGNHVWICAGALILEGSLIPSNSIVATRSIVTKKFEQENILIGGIPAKILKTGINWNGNSIVGVEIKKSNNSSN